MSWPRGSNIRPVRIQSKSRRKWARFSSMFSPSSRRPPPETRRTGLPQVCPSMQEKVCVAIVQNLRGEKGEISIVGVRRPGEQPHHRMWPCIWCSLEPLGTCLLDRADLLTDQCQPCHVAPKLLDDVCRQARALRCPQTCQTLRRLAQMRFESPDPETGERTLHAVGNA